MRFLSGRILVAFVALLAALVLSSPGVRADTFSLTDGTNTIGFTLPSNPTPVAGNFDIGYFFELDGISVDVNGTKETQSLFFFNDSQMGGLEIGDSSSILLNQSGPSVYSNTEDTPMFNPGPYSLTAVTGPFQGLYASNFTLNITDDSSVPEPSTLSMLGAALLGLFAIAGLRRKTPQSTSPFER